MKNKNKIKIKTINTQPLFSGEEFDLSRKLRYTYEMGGGFPNPYVAIYFHGEEVAVVVEARWSAKNLLAFCQGKRFARSLAKCLYRANRGITLHGGPNSRHHEVQRPNVNVERAVLHITGHLPYIHPNGTVGIVKPE